MFYTYIHRRESDGRVFYVGKGSRLRAFSRKGRNVRWQRTAAKHGLMVSIVAPWPTEADAFEHERVLIACFRELGHPLVNMTDGGEGGISGLPQSPESTERRIAALRKATRTPEYRAMKRKISIEVGNMPPRMYGSDHPGSRPVSCGEKVFNTVRDAVKWLKWWGYENASPSAIVACCRGRQKIAYDLQWSYA